MQYIVSFNKTHSYFHSNFRWHKAYNGSIIVKYLIACLGRIFERLLLSLSNQCTFLVVKFLRMPDISEVFVGALPGKDVVIKKKTFFLDPQNYLKPHSLKRMFPICLKIGMLLFNIIDIMIWLFHLESYNSSNCRRGLCR